MDRNLSYPPSLPCSIHASNPPGLIPLQPPFSLDGGGLQQGPILNPFTTSLAGVAPQSKTHISNITTGALLPVYTSSRVHQNSLPASFMATSGLYPSPTGASSPYLAPQYHPFYPSLNGCPTGTVGVPGFNPTTPFAAISQLSSPENPADDPSSTTVFVAGLPACITEETLKAFFHNFGEITYVKIPPHKGYGFVKYARREDAKQAIIKMNDFPIHENSRIRLSWGRSLGDKKVEYVKKLSSALGISFESVWKIVQGQDPAVIKQIVSTVCGRSPGQSFEPQNLPPLVGSDQQHQPAGFSEFAPALQGHSSALNFFPSVLSTQLSSSPASLPPKSSLTDAPTFVPRSTDSRYSSSLFISKESQEEVPPHQSLNFGASAAPSTRPKALSQSSVSASLPPPSWAMRASWQEWLPNEKFSQRVESPVSSTDASRFPDASIARRVTIPLAVPNTCPHEGMSFSQPYQTGSPESAVFSGSQTSSMDNLETSAFGLRNMSNDEVSAIKEKDEYQLGFDGFIQELLEEEGREGSAIDQRPSTFPQRAYLKLAGKSTLPNSFKWDNLSVKKDCTLSNNDASDWPRIFLSSESTCESETVKNIFNSMPSNPPRSQKNSTTDNSLSKGFQINRPDSPNHPSGDGHPESTIEATHSVPSASNVHASDSAIKSLDQFWTLKI